MKWVEMDQVPNGSTYMATVTLNKYPYWITPFLYQELFLPLSVGEHKGRLDEPISSLWRWSPTRMAKTVMSVKNCDFDKMNIYNHVIIFYHIWLYLNSLWPISLNRITPNLLALTIHTWLQVCKTLYKRCLNQPNLKSINGQDL